MSEQQQPEGTVPSHIVGDGGIVSVDDMTPETRAALKSIAAHEDGDDDEPVIDEAEEDAAAEVETPTPTRPDISPDAAAKEEEEAESPSKPEKQTTDATDEKFSLALGKLRETEQRVEAKRRELAEAEKKLTAHNETLKLWSDDRRGVLEKLIGDAIGTTDPAKIKEEVTALYDDLTLTILELPANPERKQAAATAKLKREVEALKQERKQEAERLAEEKRRLEHEGAVQRAISVFDGQAVAEASSYPYLVAGAEAEGATPGQIIWGVISGTYEKDGTEMTFADAARLADNHFKTKAEKFRPLFAGNSNGKPTEQASPSAKSKGKKVKGLSNAAASAAPDDFPETGHIEDDAKSIARLKKQLARLVKREDDDE